MEVTTKTKEFRYFDKYRVTHHLGCELIEIEILVKKKKFFGLDYSFEWKRIYFGHSTPIEESINFYNSSREEEKAKSKSK